MQTRCIAIFFYSLLICLSLPASSHAQDSKPLPGKAPNNLQGLTLNPTRKLEFSTNEGTWMSLDVSPDGKTVIFDLVGHIYKLSLSDVEAVPITSGLSFDSAPRFSPDGKQIVYVSDRSGADNLWISNADGSNARALTADENSGFASPTWSADGSYIFVSKKNPQFYGSVFELWMYDTKGGTGVCVMKSKTSPDAPPDTWQSALGAVASPDGRYIYYSHKLGYFSEDVKFPLWQIARHDLLTGEDDVITANQGSAIRPALSADGKELVYGTRHDGGTALRIRNLVTGADKWLEFHIQRDDQESYFSSRDLLPGYAFTPDGKYLLLSYGGKIHRLNVSTGTDSVIPFHATISRGLGPKLDFPSRVDEGPVRARIIQGAVESPDGKYLAFSALTHLYSSRTSGSSPMRLTTGDMGEYEPAWSPDGKWLAYVTWTQENGHLWKVAADGKSAPVQLALVSAYYQRPVWSPDGSHVIVLRTSQEMAMDQMDQWARPMAGLELISVPANPGTASIIANAARYDFPHFAGAGDRIFVTETEKAGMMKSTYSLVSMRMDGTDKHTLLILKGKDIWGADFTPGMQMEVAPDRKQVLAVYRSQLYLFDLPFIGGDPPTIDLSSPSVAVRRLTNVGADFASWADGGKTIAWSLGSSYFQLPREVANAGIAEAPSIPSVHQSAQQENLPEAVNRFHPQVTHIDLEVPRDTPSGVIVLRGAKIITMRGDQVFPDGDVVIHDNRILSVGPRNAEKIPDHALIVDVSGKFIVPGFIDIHDHWTNIRRGILDLENWDFLATLAYGITTGRDPQTFTNDIFVYQDLVDSGQIIGPRAYSTGPGIFWSNDFQSEAEAEDVVRRYKDYYRTKTIKSYMVGNRAQREYVAEASNNLKMMPTTEGASDLALDMTQIIDGFSAEHQFPIALQLDLVNLVAQSGAYYDPTFIIGYGGPPSENYYFETTDVHDNPKVRRFIPHNVIDAKTTRITWYRKDEYNYPSLAKSAAEIAAAGGKVCVGGHGEFQGLSFHWELWSLQSGGMSNMEALRAATLNGAEAIGLAEDLGSIEPGKLADLVVLDRDPLRDIHNTTAIQYVMKNGELFDGNTLDEIWPQKKPLPKMYWQTETEEPNNLDSKNASNR